MEEKLARAEIICSGLVQGVGFRYFVLRTASKIGVKGYTKNLFSGDVLTVAESEEFKLRELFERLKIGPMHAHVTGAKINWSEPTGEFTNFEVRY